ncbi:hypothetical protein ACU8KH_04477 [Lachancea thermotolerans]
MIDITRPSLDDTKANQFYSWGCIMLEIKLLARLKTLQPVR